MFKDKRRYLVLFKICFELKTNSYFEKGWRSLNVLIEIQYKKCQEIKVSDFRGSFSYHSALKKYFLIEKLVFLSKVCFSLVENKKKTCSREWASGKLVKYGSLRVSNGWVESGRVGSKMVKLRVDMWEYTINVNFSMSNTMRLLE